MKTYIRSQIVGGVPPTSPNEIRPDRQNSHSVCNQLCPCQATCRDGLLSAIKNVDILNRVKVVLNIEFFYSLVVKKSLRIFLKLR